MGEGRKAAGMHLKLCMHGQPPLPPAGEGWGEGKNNEFWSTEHMATHAPEMPIQVDDETGVWTNYALPMLYLPPPFF